MVHQVLFIVFGLICVAGAVNLLVQRHPINSALSLVVVMASLALIYLLLGAEFVAAIQVIVYAGAIMVLFVFVIMLLNAVNLSFVAFANYWNTHPARLADGTAIIPLSGHVFVFFVMVVAAAEAAVGLAIIISIFRTRETLNVDQVNLLKL